MTVKVLVLKSGEDVIADVKELLTSDKQVMGYLMTRPCVVKLITNAPLTADESNPKSETKSEMSVRMHPWAPLAKEKVIPITTDWVVTMITPVEKVLKMYTEDVLEAYGDNNKETDSVDSPDGSTKAGLTD
jgi:hypothetical protein|tara:strand:+ start:188 stop:580 length:393 start_codon:yes stop_codon:yes gene_type:complete